MCKQHGKKGLVFSLVLLFSITAFAQRSYKPHSVLSTGTWYKIAVSDAGVYKMDVPFMASMGITGTIPSGQIRVFGNGGAMLPEANAAPRPDDLEENAVMVVDGGDGVLNGGDYVLFFALGPHQWLRDSVSGQWHHQKNLYSDQSFYYISIGGTGKRIATNTAVFNTGISVSSFDEHIYHELDSTNFLSSGKEWFGEELSAVPGHTLTRSFPLPYTDWLPTSASVTANFVSRSIGGSSRFEVRMNNTLVQQTDVLPISGDPLDLFARQVQSTASFVNTQTALNLSLTYVPGSFNAQGWLNWFEVFGRRPLALNGNNQLLFRDAASAGNPAVTFNLANANSSTQVWDVTNPLEPQRQNTTVNGTQLSFANAAQSLHEYIAFSTVFLTPQAVGKIANQDLHNTTETDYIIITHPLFLAQAQRLAAYHQQRDGLRTTLVTTDQVYNEFSGGSPDPTALRDFAKMYFDKYRSTWSASGKYLLLFGKASFDYKQRLQANTNLLPAYETASSLDPLSTYTSDDFFGFLEDNEDINSGLIVNTLYIGVGRIPAKTVDEAKAFVDKVISYHTADAMGPWRNNANFIADDEDGDLHLQDAETIAQTTAATAPGLNQYKFYLDAFKQEGGSAGGRYPDANVAINNGIFAGTLIWNYSGHGGSQRLAEEVVADQQIVNNWNNANKLPLFIIATCDFAPFDQPTVNSLGENLLLRPVTGAIALMTTTRVVFAYSNRVMNDNYLRIALQRDSAGRYKTLGEAAMQAKNFTYQNFGDITNNRKFTLLGDPALTLAFPTLSVAPTAINGKVISAQPDTLQATQKIILEGNVLNPQGGVAADFNGTVYLSLFDKPQNITTLGNDATSPPVSFSEQTSVLFKGKASASAGRFSFQFTLPKDINYQYGAGKISLYAQNGTVDGTGFSNNILIGGIAANGSTDKEGPVVHAFLNNEQFVNGSITNPTPILLVQLTDSSGINTAGTGIGHDLVATLDGDNRTYYVLNDFYESELDNYQKGSVRFQLPQLSPGAHTLTIKAWDVLNNSSEYNLNFTVVNSDELVVNHVLNYPNPFTTNTHFWFEHNQPGINLQVRVEIFTVTGKLIKTIAQTINTVGNRSVEAEWDGRDTWGNKVAKGVYIYRLQVTAPNGKKATSLQKLVFL